MSFAIRPIRPEEHCLLDEFLYNAIFLPPGVSPPPRDIISKPEISAYIKDFGGVHDCGIVSEQDGQVVGMAWTRIIAAYGHIDDETPELAISVLPAYRNRGIGTLMMLYLFELLSRHDYSKTSLSVQKANPAVRFYERLGYEVLRENAGDFIMVKELGVHLREWKNEDASELALTLNNKKVQDHLRDGIPFPYTEKDAGEFIHKTLNAEKDTQFAFAVTYNGKMIGSIGVFRKDNVHHLTAELGYYIAEAYWGKGIMTKAVKQIRAFVFEHTDIVRIFATPFAANRASCRVLEKAGFTFEGCLRQNCVKNGKVLDNAMYALLKSPSIRPLDTGDLASAIELVWRVFCEFEAPDYSDDGTAEFKAFIGQNSMADKMASGEFKLWGAFEAEKIVGVISIKPPLHISLLFVDKQYHRRGIARDLLATVLNDTSVTCGHNCITVHSSPYAVQIYHRLGFAPTYSEQNLKGIRFTPMKRLLKG